ncbi:MAG: hypothetical protein FWF87_08475 [Synergistaceae bacterium]|nr:hypothetical protein [Synergistaceae bacterium]
MSLDFGFSRWANNTSVTNIIEDTKKIAEKYLKLEKSKSSEDRVLARKTWQELSSKYWDILNVIVDAQTELMPDEMIFDDEEQLFINYGYFCDSVTPLKKKSPDMLKKRAIPDIFQYQMFSDYIAECWAMIRGNNPPKAACGYSLEEKEKLLIDKLQIEMEETLKEMKRLIRFGSLKSSEVDDLAADLVKYLMPAMKVNMRIKEYREAPDAVKQQMNQERFRYTEAERVMEIQLSIVQKNEEEPVGIPEIDEFLYSHERIKILARKIIYVNQEPLKLQRQIERVSKTCSQFSDQMMRKELKNMIAKKREYMVVPAKLARTDTSPLASGSDMEPLTMDVVSERICEYSTLDMDMFKVPRIRMYGIPKVVLIPGQGWGSYDWSDNSIIIPAIPVNDVNKTITYALASFRWDSDEDRSIKNGYENNIKENKGKSIIELSNSFYKDYFIYLTKEKKGYRVLPRETGKTFAIIFAPRKEEA